VGPVPPAHPRLGPAARQLTRGSTLVAPKVFVLATEVRQGQVSFQLRAYPSRGDGVHRFTARLCARFESQHRQAEENAPCPAVSLVPAKSEGGLKRGTNRLTKLDHKIGLR
jgi:hypothetical protein